MDRAKVLEDEIADLRFALLRKENELLDIKQSMNTVTDSLTNNDIARYSRQILLPEIGVEGQKTLKSSSALVVGAGGLGCPAALYLVTAGVGKIGIVDHDEVEINNLHRQTLHSEESVGVNKAVSARHALLKINSDVEITAYKLLLNSANARDIISKHDVILDCTDNVPTRYLLNDACVFLNKPLISGSALQLEGQLTVYNYKIGPCYRCLYPVPPAPNTVGNCSDNGVLGAVTGVLGSLQALEAIKVILDFEDVLQSRLLIFDAKRTVFRNIRLRTRRPNCEVCSDKSIITRLVDYEQFCGVRATDKGQKLCLLKDDERITVSKYKEILDKGTAHLLIDVRSRNEYEICHLQNSINIPLDQILQDKKLNEIVDKVTDEKVPVFLLCRRGNDSQIATQHLQDKLKDLALPKDIIGGLHEWHHKIDKSFPIY